MEKFITISGLTKEFTGPYGYKTTPFKNISFGVSESDFDGKLVSILAPKGTGKSVILKILAGLYEPTSGSVNITSKNNTKPYVLYIPSEPSSFPWLNVYDNAAYPLRQNNRNEDSGAITKLISLVGLGGYETARPDNQSFGFRFRISLARALALKPDMILLDEPFAKMDHETKEEIYDLLLKVIAAEKTKIILAASNITEAFILSNKAFVMKGVPADSVLEIELSKGKTYNKEKIFLSEEYQKFLEKVEEYFSGEENKKILEL